MSEFVFYNAFQYIHTDVLNFSWVYIKPRDILSTVIGLKIHQSYVSENSPENKINKLHSKEKLKLILII